MVLKRLIWLVFVFWIMVLSTFFGATKTAALAFSAEFKFKSYYNLGFQLDALTSMFCHILRLLYDLSALLLRTVITPYYLLNPFAWLSVPDHSLNWVDNLVGSAISLATVAVQPIIFVLRSLTSMIRGYEQETDYDWGIDEEENDLSLAMAICPAL